jgi:hypothetical protein
MNCQIQVEDGHEPSFLAPTRDLFNDPQTPSNGITNTIVAYSPAREKSHRSRAILTIVSLTSADNSCQAVTSWRIANWLQAGCRQEVTASTQLSWTKGGHSALLTWSVMSDTLAICQGPHEPQSVGYGTTL